MRKSFKIILFAKLLLDLVFRTIAASVSAFALRLKWQMDPVEPLFNLPWRSWHSSNMRNLSHFFKAVSYCGLIFAATMFPFGDFFKVPYRIPLVTTIFAFIFMGRIRSAAGILAGLPVYCKIADLPIVALLRGVEEVLISITSADGPLARRVVGLARRAKIPYRIVAGIHEALLNTVNISRVRCGELRQRIHLHGSEPHLRPWAPQRG